MSSYTRLEVDGLYQLIGGYGVYASQEAQVFQRAILPDDWESTSSRIACFYDGEGKQCGWKHLYFLNSVRLF